MVQAHWSIFLPALCVYPLWITIGLRENLFPTMADYWPIGAAMIIGSMIAGSTPLGGGIVAFPVTLLVLGFSSAQGRDASLLIQSVGMTAASYLILYKKRSLISDCTDLITKFIVMSTVGLVIGFQLLGGLSPLIVEIVYATLVVCVVLVFIYFDFIESKANAKLGGLGSGGIRATRRGSDANLVEMTEGVGLDMDPESGASKDEDDAFNDDSSVTRRRSSAASHVLTVAEATQSRNSLPAKLYPSVVKGSGTTTAEGGIVSSPSSAALLDEETEELVRESELAAVASPPHNENRTDDEKAAVVLQNIVLCVFAVTGGILSSLIGSGADIACYLYGSFVYCKFGPTREQLGDNSLTAASVIVMASMSVFGSILRVASREVDTTVYHAWFASAQVVVLGAPTGSLFLTPRNQRRLKYAFYALGLIQLVLFGVMKIGSNGVAWIAVCGCIFAVMSSLFVHFMVYSRAVEAHELD